MTTTLIDIHGDKISPEPNSGCWLWTGCYSFGPTYGPYGYVKFEGKMRRAHRVAWQISNGPIPSGKVIRHKCHVPLCCNPDHLLIGTQADNVKDRDDRGFTPKGERHGQSVLTCDDVEQIKSLRSEGWLYQEIADQYGMSPHHISDICRGNRWNT